MVLQIGLIIIIITKSSISEFLIMRISEYILLQISYE